MTSTATLRLWASSPVLRVLGERSLLPDVYLRRGMLPPMSKRARLSSRRWWAFA